MARNLATQVHNSAKDRGGRFYLSEVPVPTVFATYRIIRDCNEAFAQLFSLTRDAILDQSFSRLYPKLADFVQIGQTWRAHLSGGQRYFDERLMKGADGTSFWCRVNGISRTPSDPFAEAIYCFEPIPRPRSTSFQPLSDRQRQIVTLVSQGKTNSEIADELELSKRTVEAHRARLMKTIGVRNAAELVAWFSTTDR